MSSDAAHHGVLVTINLLCGALAVLLVLGVRAGKDLALAFTTPIALLAGAGLGASVGLRAYDPGGSGGLEGIGLIASGAAGLIAGPLVGWGLGALAKRARMPMKVWVTAVIAAGLAGAAASWTTLVW